MGKPGLSTPSNQIMTPPMLVDDEFLAAGLEVKSSEIMKEIQSEAFLVGSFGQFWWKDAVGSLQGGSPSFQPSFFRAMLKLQVCITVRSSPL